MLRITSGSAVLALCVCCGVAEATPIVATEGSQFAYLSTRTSGGDSGRDRTGAFGNEFDIASMVVGVPLVQGDLLTFDLDVLTSGLGLTPDIFLVALDGTPVLRGSIGAVNGQFPAITLFQLPAISDVYGATYANGRLGFGNLLSGVSGDATYSLGFGSVSVQITGFSLGGFGAGSAPISTAGTHYLSFMIADDSGPGSDSALLVDNIRVNGNVIAGFEADAVGALPGPPVLGFGDLSAGLTDVVTFGNVSVADCSTFTSCPDGSRIDEPSFLLLALTGLALLMGAQTIRRPR